MAGEQPRVAQAFIELHARKAADFDAEVRHAGKEAGRAYEREFEREAGKDSPAAKGQRERQGKAAGTDIGRAAGQAAGDETSKGITTGLARSRSERKKDGDEFGRILGTAAGERASSEVIARFRHNRRGFEREGQSAGRSFGDGMRASFGSRALFAAGIVTGGLRARFKAGGRTLGLDTAGGISDALKRSGSAFVEDGRALGAIIGASAGRRAAQLTRASVKLELAAAGKEAAAAERAAEAAQAAFNKRMTKIQETGNRIIAGILRPIAGGQGLAGKLLSGPGLGALAASASSLGTVLSGTVGAVTALSGAVGLLPGVLTAAGIGAVALKVGLGGVGDAIKSSGDPKAFAEALKQLSPAAASFTRAVVKMKPQLKDLRESVQEGLFKGFAQQVTALGTRYLPILQKGLTKTAEGFATSRTAVADYLNTAKSSGAVAGILDDTSTSAAHLSRVFKPFVAAFLDVASTGTSFLPDLTTKLGNAADRLSAFTSRSKSNGSMADFFKGGIDAVGNLASALKGAGRILAGIFKAGGGANTSALETFAGLLNRVADQVGRPEFQAGLSHFFGSIGDAGKSVGDALPRVGDALVALEPAISKLVSGSGQALASVLTTASDAAIALAPTLNVLAGALASLGPHAGAIVVALLGVKAALSGLSLAAGAVDSLTLIGAQLDKVGLSAVTTRARVGGLSGSLGILGAAAAVVGIAALARLLGDLSGKANVATVNTAALTSSLKTLGQGGQLAGAGLQLFTNKGVFGLVSNDADSSAEALDRFGVAAFNALDKGWDARLGRWQSFGQAESSFRKQTEQLDKSFTALTSRGSIDQATGSFQKFIAAGVKAGVPVASLKAQFPQFSAALARAGLTVDNTSGKVVYLTGALKGLPTSKAIRINTPGMTAATARAYGLQQALRRLPKNKVVTVTTRFFQVGKEPGTFGNGLGVFRKTGGIVDPNFVQRRQAGGLVNRLLGAPRQDNVPLLGSGGEFMVNAWATAAPGVEPLLRYINTANRLPEGFASGGKLAGTAVAGLDDLTLSQPARTQRLLDARTPPPVAQQQSRMHRDDLDYLVRGFARALREQPVVLDAGTVAGAVFQAGGRF